MINTNDYLDLLKDFRQARNVAAELAKLLRKDATLFNKINPRSLRWIKKQEKIEREKKDANDEVLRLARIRRVALAKLSRRDKMILGLPDDTPTED